MTVSRFRIHPGIGVARVGDADVGSAGSSPDGFFIGPETPGVPANWDFRNRRCFPFKAEGKVKRQAARFRIWEYEEREGRMIPIREVTLDTPGVASIAWSVEVANKKASFYTFREEKGSADRFDGDHPRRNEDVRHDRELALEIRPGVKSISGRFGAPVDLVDLKTRAPIQTLGQLRTDEEGRLVFLGGTGIARGPEGDMPHAYNNPGWFDDVSDGSVDATIVLRDDSSGRDHAPIKADGAWVIVAPPDFAPAITSVVTLYDLLVDLAVRPPKAPAGDERAADHECARRLHGLDRLTATWSRSGGRRLTGYRPSYAREILPILWRAAATRWVHDSGYSFHEWVTAGYPASFGDPTVGADVRQAIFSWLRDPAEKKVRPWLMPRTFADNYGVEPRVGSRHLSLTRTQYEVMRRWAAGRFEADGPAPAMPDAPNISPEGLDRAALEGCSGGGFCPGMEVGWLITKSAAYSEPFRIERDARIDDLTVGPGFFSQQVAVPWHADFWECQKEEDTEAAGVYQAWWPANRPDDVRIRGRESTVEWNRRVDSKVRMVQEWSNRGFVVPVGQEFLEEEGPRA